MQFLIVAFQIFELDERISGQKAIFWYGIIYKRPIFVPIFCIQYCIYYIHILKWRVKPFHSIYYTMNPHINHHIVRPRIFVCSLLLCSLNCFHQIILPLKVKTVQCIISLMFLTYYQLKLDTYIIQKILFIHRDYYYKSNKKLTFTTSPLVVLWSKHSYYINFIDKFIGV